MKPIGRWSPGRPHASSGLRGRRAAAATEANWPATEAPIDTALAVHASSGHVRGPRAYGAAAVERGSPRLVFVVLATRTARTSRTGCSSRAFEV